MSDPNMHYDGTRWLRWDGTQWLDAQSGQPAAGAPAPSSGSKKALWLVMGGIGAVMVIGVIGLAAGGSSAPSAAPSSSATPTVTAAPTAPTPVAPPPVAPEPEPATGPMTVIEEGDWVVGEDIVPGTYRTAATVSGFCYWGIYKAGTNHANIIDNGVATGGRPTVTLKKGQEFTNQGCGMFVKK